MAAILKNVKMNCSVIIDQLIAHEGLKLKPYRCSAGKLTIGVGRNLEGCGISQDEALVLLDHDIAVCVEDLQKLFGVHFGTLPEIARRVLIDMRFNLGPKGFRSFKKFIQAINELNFEQASAEMIDSKWYTQVGVRGVTLVKMIEKCWITKEC